MAQLQRIGDVGYCQALLKADQSIDLSQTDNGFKRALDGRNKQEARSDGYVYSNASVTVVYRRSELKKHELISLRLDETHTARFPLFLYAWR